MSRPILPLRWVVPLVILLFGALLGGVWTVHSLGEAYERVEKSGIEATRFIAVFVGPQLEAFFRRGEVQRAETFLNRLNADPELGWVLLVDARGKVLYSSRFAEIGRSTDSLGLGELDRVRSAALGAGRDLVDLNERRDRVLGAFPVEIAPVDSALGHRQGILLVERDLRFLKSRARSEAVAGLLRTLGVLVLLCLLAWLFLERLITRRLWRLIQATRRLADGEVGARAGLEGHDELASLGRAFDAMAERVESAQEDLLEREASFRQLIEHGTDIIGVVNADGIVRFVSPSVRRILGREPDDLVGRSGFDLVHPDDRAVVEESLADTLASPAAAPPVEVRARHADGHWVHLEAIGNSPPERKARREVVINARDVSAWKILQEQLRQSQKMKAVGQLAGGIAHDFNNLLTAILGYCDLLEAELPEDSPGCESTAEIRRAGERGSSLVRQLLAFGRKQVLRLEVLELDGVVLAMEGLLRRTLGERIEMVISPSRGPCTVCADRGQLEQVLLNLVVNARDAMPAGGRLEIATRAVMPREVPEGRLPTEDGAEGVLLSVGDTGSGIDDAIREEIFDPFFTTKVGGEGAGLGLAMVHGIVTQSGGSVWVESRPGSGATFNIWLPQADDVARPAEAGGVRAGDARLDEAHPGGARSEEPSGTRAANAPSAEMAALIVEDERPIRKIVAMILARRGYRTLEAEDVRTARRLLADRSDPLALLISDIVLPDGSGSEVAHLVHRRHAETAIVLMSGYAEEMLLRAGEDNPFTFLPKPFSADALLSAIDEARRRVPPGDLDRPT